MWIEYSCLITFFCAGAFLDPIVKGVSPPLPPCTPPPPLPHSTPLPSPSISTVYWRKGKFQCNLQISRKLYSSIGHFPTVQWYYLISARPLSYISTYILFQHEVWKKDLDTWTTYWLYLNWNLPIYNSIYTFKKDCVKKYMIFFTQVWIFAKTLHILNAKVKAILYQHFTLVEGINIRKESS